MNFRNQLVVIREGENANEEKELSYLYYIYYYIYYNIYNNIYNKRGSCGTIDFTKCINVLMY